LSSVRVAALAALATLAIGSSAGAQPAQLQSSGLRIRQLTSPTPGSVMALVEVEAPHDAAVGASPSADAFTLWVNDGAGKDLKVQRNGKRGAGVTIFLVDESGSYKNRGFRAVADPVIRSYVSGAGASEELGLFLFSTTASPYPVRVGSAALLGDLDNATRRPAGGDTNLYTGLINAIELAGKQGAPGLRDLILFTDAGDEAEIAAAKWTEITEKALARSVRIHVAVSIERPKNIPKDRYFNTTNALEDLTRATAGVYDKSGDGARVGAALTSARDATRNWVVVEAALCGMSQRAPATIKVEYVARGVRKAWSGAAQLADSAWAPSATAICPALCTPDCADWEECIGGVCAPRACGPNQSCPGGAECVSGKCDKPCTEACASWQTCRAGECVAKTCSSDEQCGVDATCKDGLCVATPLGFMDRYLVWLLAGLAGLLLLGGVLLLRRKPKPEPEAELAPMPEPEAAPEPEMRAAPINAPDLDALPEMHLEAIGGWPTQGEKWRLYKRMMQVGASKDPGDGNDIVFGLPKISGTHARFQLYPSGDLWVIDLGSSNGTFVNGRRLASRERAKLKPGDQVKISGALTLKVVKPNFDSDLEEPEESNEASAVDPAAKPEPEPTSEPASKKKTRFDPGNR
jgi:hypothetical protein